MALSYDYLKGLQKNQGASSSGKTTSNKGDGLSYEYLKGVQQNRSQNLAQMQNLAPIKTITTTKKKKKKDEEERKWFNSGLFEDGYDFGDISKTLLGSGTDIVEDLSTGIVGMGEKAWDGLLMLGTAMNNQQMTQSAQNQMMYNAVTGKETDGILERSLADQRQIEKETAEYVKKDLYDEEKIAKKIITNPVEKVSGINVEDTSVFGEKSDSLIQSGGQLLATAGLQAVGVPWFVTTGATAYGSQAEQSLNEGATFNEANASALISAGAEILTEKLSGGIKFGGKTLDDVLVKSLTEKISGKTLKTLANLGLDAVGEGSEEVISSIMSNLGTALYKEDKVSDILFSEEAVDEYIESFIGGAVLGGVSSGFRAVREGVKENYTENEQKVIDKEVENRIAEVEQDGKTLTKAEKSKIRADVLNDLEKGYISIDTIESALGGETYENYKSVSEQEEALQKEFDTLNKMRQLDMTGEQIDRRTELKQQLEELKTTSNKTQLKEQLSNSVFGLAKDSRLSESYNEKTRRSQSFEADLTKYDEKQRAVIQKATESGILNNTNRTHEFVDMIAKISADKGVLFDFTNNQKLKESGFAVEGKTVNGYVTNDGNISLNIDSSKSLNSVAGHEITHVLEGTELYTELQEMVKQYATTKGEYDTRLKTLTEIYKGVEGANIENELTADLVGDYLFTDSDFINKLSTEKPNLFKRIYNEIKYLYKVATAGSKEARELEKVKRAFEKAYKESANKTNDDTEVTTEDTHEVNTKYSLVTDEDTIAFLENQDYVVTYKAMQVIDGKLYPPMSAEHKVEEEYTNKKGEKKVRTVKKLKQPSELGKWQQSEENVELAKQSYDAKKGYSSFELLKGDGKSLKGVAYNPYEHTSNIVLNDQFSSAHRRDNLVTVEYHIPVSELTSGYKAEYAKDAVGKRDWHTGLVASNLKNSHRDVYLTRWSKPVRVLSDAEVAQKYKEILDKEEGVTVPWNVVTQSLREELENVGVPIDYSDKKIGTATFNFEASLRGEYLEQKKNSKSKAKNKTATKYSLTAEQENYFKDSKVRDENGNLKVMYHGTSKGGHTVFDTYGSNYGLFGQGSYFTDNKSVAESYTNKGKGNNKQVYESYLNITKPLDMDKQGNIDEWKKAFPEADFSNCKTNEEFYRAVEEYYSDQMMPKWEVAEIIKDSIQFNMGYDGITHIGGGRFNKSDDTRHRVYIAFESEQIKNIDNIAPTKNPDIRYSLSDSEGNKLSKGQQEYFKDSKLVDDNGNLKVMYHGSQEAGFHEFSQRFSDDDTSFFFVDSNTVAKSYSGTSETYTAQTLRKADDFNRFFEEIGATEYEVVEADGKFSLLEDGDEIATSNTAKELYNEFCDWTGLGQGSANYKVYLNLTNPLVVDAKNNEWDNLGGWIKSAYINKNDVEVKRVDNEFRLYDKNGTEIENSSITVTKSNENINADTLRSIMVNKVNNILHITTENMNTTRDVAKWAKNNGYDGVIFKNIIDNGAYASGGDRFASSTVAIAFESNQIKSVANTNPTKKADIRYSLSEDSEGRELSPAIQKRFGNSKVVDENGYLKPVYHGTATGEFTIFDKSKGSVEGDFGSGFYFTDNEADVTEHYEGGGPDFENKVARRAEQIEIEEEIDYDEAEKRAREELFKGGHKFEVYLNIENPAIVGETFLFDNESYLEEYGENDFDDYDEYIAEVEQLVTDDIDRIIWEVERNVDIYSTDGLSNILFEAYYEGGIGIEELKSKINELYLEDNNGNLVGNEVTRQIIESLGYDGIIDNTVSSKWNMDMEEGTTHYIVFKPNQIKSVTNQNPTDNEDINLSLSKSDEPIAPIRQGKYNVYGKDIAYQPTVSKMEQVENAIAPIQEGVAKNTTTTKSWRDVVANNNEPLADENGVINPNYNDILSKVDSLLEDELIRDIESGMTSEELLEKSKSAQKEYEAWQGDYNTISGTITPYMLQQQQALYESASKNPQDILYDLREEQFNRDSEAEQQERLNSFTDVDIPPLKEAPIYDKTMTPKSLFDNEDRPIEAVGNRKIKAYMYENPEVKPFFQNEAYALLDELQNSIKGERWYDADLAYETHNEKGWFGTTRYTSDDIAHLLDEWHYTYADIEKGLNAIIEDNGKENNAISKRIEFYIDERLRNGYTDFMYGVEIPPNQEYINLLTEKQVTEYSDEAWDNWLRNLTEDDIPRAIESEGSSISKMSATDWEALMPPTKEYEAIMPKPEKLSEEEKQWAKNKMVRADKGKKPDEKIAKILMKEPEAKKNNFKRNLERALSNFVDKGTAVETLALEKGNRELDAKYNTIRYANTKAQTVIGEGVKEKGVKSINDIFGQIKSEADLEKFYNYLYHKHNVDRMSLESREAPNLERLTEEMRKLKLDTLEENQLFAISKEKVTKNTTGKRAHIIETVREYLKSKGVKNKAVFGDSVTAEISQEIVEKYEFENPDFIQVAEDIYNYNRHLRSEMVEGGVISQETADLFEELYPHYVPIRRVNHNGSAVNVPLDTRRTGINAPIKRAEGGNSDILPLAQTMAQRTLQTYKAVAKNRFGVELKNTLGTTVEKAKTDIDEIIEGVDTHEELLKEGKHGANPTFTVFENGEKVTFEITEALYDALKPTSEALSQTFNIVSKPTGLFKKLVTEYNPAFMLTNPIKDTQDVLINSQHPLQTYKNYPKAIKELISKGEWYNEYLKNGGSDDTYFDKETNTFTEEKSGVKKVVGFPFEKISDANNFLERLPRLAEYIASREAGRSIDVAMLDSSRVTTNFRAGGDITKFLNRNGFTFLNPSVQGAVQQVRNVREAKANGLKGWALLATKVALAGLPSMLLNGLLWDDDEDYEKLSDYVKQNYYVVWKNEDGKFIRVPKGRALAVIQNAFTQVQNALTGDDEVDIGSFLELVANNIAPNNPLENNILAPIMQVKNNKTWYGEDLVPSRLQDLPAKEQFDESTDKFSKWLGGKLNVSPVKVNYLLNQYSGGVGDMILPMLTPEAESGKNSVLSNFTAPIRDKFTTDSVMNNQNVSNFYEVSDELKVNANSSEATEEDILKNKYFNAIRTEMSELYKEKREIQNNEYLSDSEKYNRVREIQEEINTLSEEALNSYNTVEISGKYAEIGDKQYKLNSDNEWQKISDEEIEKQNEVIDILGITKSQYWNNKKEYDMKAFYPEKYAVLQEQGISVEDYKENYEEMAHIYTDDYSWASQNPEKYAVSKAVTDDVSVYKQYTSDLYNIKADKDSNGKSISGSRKEKVHDYIFNLDIEDGAKYILFKSEYNADDTYNDDIVDYLNNRDDISSEEMVTILQELGATVDAEGYIYW